MFAESIPLERYAELHDRVFYKNVLPPFLALEHVLLDCTWYTLQGV
jgi:hypothetical protein